jgi:hypothetical protein
MQSRKNRQTKQNRKSRRQTMRRTRRGGWLKIHALKSVTDNEKNCLYVASKSNKIKNFKKCNNSSMLKCWDIHKDGRIEPWQPYHDKNKNECKKNKPNFLN